MTKNELTLKLDRARWHIISASPFYGSLMMALSDKLGNPHGKTACVDGKTIFWDCDFLGKLSDEETRFVLLHETLHCAHGHLWRFPAGKVDHSTANQACDHAINLTLNSAGLKIAMPAGGLADGQFSGMAEEEIFTALSQKPKNQDKPGKDGKPQAGGAGDGQAGPDDPCGDFTAPANESAASGKPSAKPGNSGDTGNQAGQADDLREKWERAVIQAAQAAKASGRGDVPGDMAAELSKIACVKIDWRAETAEFVRNSISTKNDWIRGNRRMLWQNVVYPSRRADLLGKIFVACDVSGSVFHRADEFKSIIAAAAAELDCSLILCDFDTRITAEIETGPGDDVPLTVCGGGGTDFADVFGRAAALMDGGEKIAGVILLTDLDGSNFPANVEYPLLTVCTGNQQAPTGRTVQIL